MEITDFIGYLGAFVIGIVLGLVGGGGSILTVPVLVYLFAVNPVTATGYSLFVVGVSSLVGTAKNLRSQLIGFKTGLAFGAPAVIAVYSARKFIIPAIPEELYSSSHFVLTRGTAIMVLFAMLMLISGVTMIAERKNLRPMPDSPRYALLLILGFFTGILTGVVGAGGGFIIIPILVILAGLPMKKAVATSLFIIALNSLLGFLGDLGRIRIEWDFLLLFSSLAVAGIFLGSYLNRIIEGHKLKRGFGIFVLLMGVYIFWKEIL